MPVMYLFDSSFKSEVINERRPLTAKKDSLNVNLGESISHEVALSALSSVRFVQHDES
jgi:hypothetical protein